MKKYNITCSMGHRLFDVSEGSNMRIRIKCANQKICSHKAVCKRKTEIIFGECDDLSGQFESFSCTACNKRLFDTTRGSVGTVDIKCDHCGKVNQISIKALDIIRQAIYA